MSTAERLFAVRGVYDEGAQQQRGLVSGGWESKACWLAKTAEWLDCIGERRKVDVGDVRSLAEGLRARAGQPVGPTLTADQTSALAGGIRVDKSKHRLSSLHSPGDTTSRCRRPRADDCCSYSQSHFASPPPLSSKLVVGRPHFLNN
uniref:Uncharacterized protein n=1 Tax=Plectus sambesii TaxID=2011161 RepID=A0A914W9K9_9BILA